MTVRSWLRTVRLMPPSWWVMNAIMWLWIVYVWLRCYDVIP